METGLDTSWLAAATQMTTRIIPVFSRVLCQMSFLPQPFLFPGLGPAKTVLVGYSVARFGVTGKSTQYATYTQHFIVIIFFKFQ